MHSFAQLRNLNILSKIAKVFAKFWKMLLNFDNFCKINNLSEKITKFCQHSEFLTFFKEKCDFRYCEGVDRVDLGESFQSSFQIDPNPNEYLLPKFGFDTAENEDSPVYQPASEPASRERAL